jgi:hypothetical protein
MAIDPHVLDDDVAGASVLPAADEVTLEACDLAVV